MIVFTVTNAQIAKILSNVAAAYTIRDEKKFRFQILAYQKAAETIEHLSSEVYDYYKNDTLESLPGVGASIKASLEELLRTGKVKHFNELLKDTPETIFPLIEIPSFGPKRAYKLVREFDLKNPATVIDDLEKIAKSGKIANIPGFGEKSQSDILRAIDEYRRGVGKTTRMVLPYALEVAENIVSYLLQSKDVVRVEPLGSLRRRVETVGDIDLAVASNKPKAVINHFVKCPFALRIIEQGDVSASIIISGGRQIDLLIQPVESFGSLLQHFTGSKDHNVHLRELALKRGLSLSEYGIKKKGKVEKYNSEEKFYEAIGLDWIPPEIREDKGEIELATAHKLPKLIEVEDLKGDLHLHSSYPIEPSHDMGLDSMEIMLDKGKELGYEYLGFSEHNPSVSKHTSERIYEILIKRDEKIEQLKSSNKYVRVFKLLEVDILPNGKLAIDDKSMNLLDAALISIHSVFSMDKETMTKRVLSALAHKKAKILSHPTGRLLNTRPGYELDWEKIFDFCKKNNKALEINSWPNRLDLSANTIKMAVEAGVKMVINTDSHRVNQMEMRKYGISMARRGWAKKSDILNTLSYNQFASWLKE